MQSTATTVYRLYGDGHLLYVGITSDIRRRFRQHAKRNFAPLIDYVTVYTYKTRETAERVEATAIAREHPLFNIDWGTRWARENPVTDGIELWREEMDYAEWAVGK